jgi:hypothetical protein
VSSAEDFDSRATGTTDEERNAHISQADAAALFCALGGLKLLQSIRLCSEDLLVSQQAVSPLLNFVRTTQAKDINLELPRPEDVPLDEYGYLCGQIADALETQTFKVIQLLVTVLDDRFGRALSGNKHLRTLMVTVRPHIVNVRHNAATAGNGFFHNLRNLARLTVLHYVDTSPLNVASLLDLTYRSPIETLYLAQQNISEGDLKLLTKGLARCTSLRSVLSASWKGRDMPCHIIYPSDEDFDDTSELEFGELESEFPERRSDDDDSDEDLRHRGTLANTPIRNTNA